MPMFPHISLLTVVPNSKPSSSILARPMPPTTVSSILAVRVIVKPNIEPTSATTSHNRIWLESMKSLIMSEAAAVQVLFKT